MFIEQINVHHSKGPPEAMLIVKISKLQLKCMHLCRPPLPDTKSWEKLEELGFLELGLLSFASHL